MMLSRYSVFKYESSRTLQQWSEMCFFAYTISDVNETVAEELKWTWNYTGQTPHDPGL